jgi:hypothetical protein
MNNAGYFSLGLPDARQQSLASWHIRLTVTGSTRHASQQISDGARRLNPMRS